MDGSSDAPPAPRLVHHRTLHALCEQLRRSAPKVIPPVHLFDIPPQVMRGLFSVAWVTRERELHRCVLAYRDAVAIADERRLLARVLLWGELDQADGRIEVGANTGEVLRYFLPDTAGAERRDRRTATRSLRDWESAARRGEGAKRAWLARGPGGGSIGGISAGGTHYLVRLSQSGHARVRNVCRELGCEGPGVLPEGSFLFRDVMGEWSAE